MENASSTPPDGLRAWLEATGGGDDGGGGGGGGGLQTRTADAKRPPSRRLLTLTGVMTAVALALGAVALADRAPRSSGAAAAPIAVTSSPVAGASPHATAAATHPLPATSDQSAPAAAVLAVRTASGPDAYVDTAVAEHVDHHPGFSVVTVQAWVLYRDAGNWDAGRALRYGVAVSDAAGAPVLARPWPLHPPTARPPRRQWRALDDAELATAAAGALRAAGYRDVADVEVRSDPALPGVVSVNVTATDPAGRPPRRHEVWLSPDATRVLGTASVTDLPIPLEQP